MAILCDDKGTMATLLADKLVMLVDGNIDRDVFVKVRCEDQFLLILAEDLRSESILKQTA
jgi:hypothetical protein